MEEDVLVCPFMTTVVLFEKFREACYEPSFVKCIKDKCAVWRPDWVSCHMGCQPGHCAHHGDEAGFDQGYCGLRGK